MKPGPWNAKFTTRNLYNTLGIASSMECLKGLYYCKVLLASVKFHWRGCWSIYHALLAPPPWLTHVKTRACQLKADWRISKINLLGKVTIMCNANVGKYITSRKLKFDSVWDTCCIQAFLKWNGSHRNPGLFSRTCLFLDNLDDPNTILTKTPNTPTKTRVLKTWFHWLLQRKIPCSVTVGGLYPIT